MPNENLILLRRSRDVAALEAFNVAINPMELMRRLLPRITQSFHGFTNAVVPTDPAIALKGDQKEFVKLMSKHSYMDIRDLLVYVPEGMTSSYSDYANVLSRAVDYAVEIERQMTAFNSFLAVLVTNRVVSSTNVVSNMNTYKALASQREDLNNAFAECFKGGTTKAESTIGKVVQRNADWEHVFAQANLLAERMNKINRKHLNDAASTAARYLEQIQHQSKHDGDVAPEVVNELAEGAFQMASGLEFFAIVYYRVQTLVAALSNTTEQVTASLKR